MIEVKLSQIIESAESFQKLCSQALPALLSFRLAKVAKKLDEEVKQFHEARLKKAAEIGTLSEDKSKYEFSPQLGILFQQELENILQESIHLPIEKIKVDDIKSIDLEPKHFIALDWLIYE